MGVVWNKSKGSLIYKKCRIEALKTTFHEDLAKQYGCKNLGKCPMHKVGDIFYDDCSKRDGLCDEAWKPMYQYVFTLSHGCEKFYYKNWIYEEGIAICSCNDVIPPVIFKIDATDEESKKKIVTQLNKISTIRLLFLSNLIVLIFFNASYILLF